MKPRMIHHLLATLVGVAFTAQLHAQTTAFTYQGWLEDNGSPANGLYDFGFSLYDAASGGAQQGATLATNGLPVSNGLFTVTLDFGDQFPGADRWLEVAVRSNNCSCAFKVLAPLQKVTSTPYALHSANAATAATANSVAAGNITGTIDLTQLPTTIVTNGASGVSISGLFSGDGNSLSNLNAAALSGTVPTSVLSNAWQTGGNSGTTAGANFLGTADNQPLEVKVNSQRALRLEPGAYGPNIIGGASDNSIMSGSAATIGGGQQNTVNGNYGTIGGGLANISISAYATVGGGNYNSAGDSATVAGGSQNQASGIFATVGGGVNNIAGGSATVAGGNQNSASGNYSTVPGGLLNAAAASYSMAAGFRAKANHQGTFVWADSTAVDFASTGNNQFLIRAAGGVGIGTTNPAGAMLRVAGTINATSYTGDGSGLTNLSNLNASQLTSGTVPDARLSANVALLNRPVQSFTGGTNSFVGKVGIGTASPTVPLSFSNILGNKISFWANGDNHYGIGVQGGLLQIFADSPGSDIAFGHGSSTNLTESVRFKGNGNVGIGTTNPTNKLDVAGNASAVSFITTSDRNAKENFQPVSPAEVLTKVAALPIQQWTFKTDAGTMHIGPMAQDFYTAFGVGPDDKHIATVDADGVALAAIQGLNEKFEGGMEHAEVRTQELERKLDQKDTAIAELKARLEKLERLLNEKLNGGGL